MKRVMVHLVMVCVVFLLFSCMGTTPGPSEPTNYTIDGTVKLWDGSPLADVTIIAGQATTTTDQNGNWRIEGLTGTVVVRAEKDGYYIVVDGTNYYTSIEASNERTINFTAYHDVNDRFGGGTGTQDDPYIIVNVWQLNRVRDYLHGHYRQIRDLDLNDLIGANNGSSDPTHNWDPIGLTGSSYNSFVGSYDGSGFSIKNMIIYTGSIGGAGMFMELNGATLKNIVVENSIIITNNECRSVGVIAAVAINSTIDNVNVYNSQFEFRRTSYFVGALIGQSARSIYTDCSAVGINVQLAGREYDVIRYAGGFVGVANNSSTFENCSVEATVTGTFWKVGGFAGSSFSSIFKNCDSKAKLKGKLTTPACMGGFVGDIGSSVFQDCHVLFGSSIELLDSQSDNSYIGGFVGKAEHESTAPDMIEFKGCSVDITIEGSVTIGASYLGGFAGKVHYCSVEDCDVETTLRFAGNNITYAGGFAGYSVVSSFSGCDVSDATLSVDNCTQVGGFAGDARDSDFTNCTFDGQLIIEPVGGNGYVAGFVAYALAQSENRYLSSCTVHSGSSITLTATPTTTQYIGGLIGYGSGQSDSIKLIVSNNHVRISLDAPESQNIQSDPLIAQNDGNVVLDQNDAQWEQ